jgi:hypothetical protein
MAIPNQIQAITALSKTRYLASWLLAVMTAGIYLHFSWHHFDDPTRHDGNRGHTYMDFGGQYLLGRMLARCQGCHLFERSFQRQVLQVAYLKENQSLAQEISDAEMLMSWFMGKDDQAQTDNNEIGGPLYPPIQAFWFYPLAMFPPQVAYRILQILIVFGAFGSGWGLTVLSKGRVWWSMASLFVLLFPGFAGSLGLGQNSVFSLAILIWGWVLVSRGRHGWGGLIWGLLAFKPVWAAAFFLVPLWTGRWRVCLAMLASGFMQFALTIPVVGWHGWVNWLQVSAEALRVSTFDEVWIVRGRDLVGLPRRWLDFNAPTSELQANLPTNLIGWGLWLLVLELTTRVAILQRNSKESSVASAFHFLGAWLCCLHFMYYDVLLAALPVFLMYQGVRWPHWICHILVGILFLAPGLTELGLGEPGLETFCLSGLWIASGWVWIRSECRDISGSLQLCSGRER